MVDTHRSSDLDAWIAAIPPERVNDLLIEIGSSAMRARLKSIIEQPDFIWDPMQTAESVLVDGLDEYAKCREWVDVAILAITLLARERLFDAGRK